MHRVHWKLHNSVNLIVTFTSKRFRVSPKSYRGFTGDRDQDSGEIFSEELTLLEAVDISCAKQTNLRKRKRQIPRAKKNTVPLVFQRGKKGKDASVTLNGRAYVSSFWPLRLFGFLPREAQT